MINLWGIILAGGEGIRLQKFSNQFYGYNRPKQYCAFCGTRSMFKHTVDRASILIPQNRLMAVVNSNHNRFVKAELNTCSELNIVEQPCLRGTAAGILFPLLKIRSINFESTVAVFPSDHFILNEVRFMEHVRKAFIFVENNPKSIVLLGIQPEKIEKGYGWLEPSSEYYGDGETDIFSVKNFVEKPDVKTMTDFLRMGYLINTFVMVGKCSTFINCISQSLPDLAIAFHPIQSKFGTDLEHISICNLYKYLPDFNFSKSVLEKIPDRLMVLKIKNVYWSDWGDEERIKHDLGKLDLCIRNFAIA